ncbi:MULTISPECIES: TRAP transporter permease [Thioalkalivibrio]|uniref:C4-dicarboxylate ABC transporter n=1 Tax=Thioalkalivibrio halophilus TaxID=252474 RepID=A0A1V2ZY20_9GAMM|nr:MULTISPECIES: TRAP transporter permease [Thioalkalivibrio]OOC09965.1 C4-dicarboxylate ABC transporter [Thioalkalivibrio halophilus]
MTEPERTPPQSAAPQEIETGARHPGTATRSLIFVVAVAWSLFQLWIASPLPDALDWFTVSDTDARAVHLAFAVFLAFLLFPAFRPTARRALPTRAFGFAYGLGGLALLALGAWQFAGLERLGEVYAALGVALLAVAWPLLRGRDPLDRVPLTDWIYAGVAAFSALYLYLFHEALGQRAGAPTEVDLILAGVGLILLLEAARRVLGPALTLIAAIFLFYTFAGPLMPDIIAHRGASYPRAMAQQWLSNEGVFGIALGVSTSFVFLFVLFGALLERAGAGDYFIRVAFALLGHMRGGPAKAAVIASGMTGLVSGSSIANTVTTGTFTIPLMKRVGFPAHKAGAIEVASSVNGQLMPPVMGAAAFLMVEYVGITYVEVLKHAILPALIAYIALLYIVHLEACKGGMEGLQRAVGGTLRGRLIAFGLTLSSLIILAAAVYWGLGWIKDVADERAAWIIAGLLFAAYLVLLWIAAREPDPEPLDTDRPLPRIGPTVLAGMHFILPLVVLVWALVVERLSPGLAAFWAVAFMIFIVLTQRPLVALFRRSGGLLQATWAGIWELFNGFATGARNMIGIGVATAAAGIIVGTVAMTGLGLVLTDVVDTLSGGNLLLVLLLTAVISLILGLGLPTTANYIVVATLMAPIVVELGAQNDVLIPLIAAHLFVFYFGIMADVTPPVGLASFAGAAVAKADPVRTGLQAFAYSLRTVALPFFFIFNSQLLLIGVDNVFQLALVFFGSLAGILAFTAATQGWFLTRSRYWESALLLVVAFTLLAPTVLMDRIAPAHVSEDPATLTEVVDAAPEGANLRLRATGLDLEGREVTRTVMFPLSERRDDPLERLSEAGLDVDPEERTRIRTVAFGSPAARVGLEGGWEITAVLVPTDRPSPYWFYLPALALGLVVVWNQRRRDPPAGPGPATAAPTLPA